MKRIFLVYNPNSSRYVDVQKEVIARVTKTKGCLIGKYAIKKAPFEENVANLTKLFEDGDLAIVAGGDATAAVTANAIMQSKKDVTLGVLPYGNFNDLARTLGTMKYEDVFGAGGRDPFFEGPKTWVSALGAEPKKKGFDQDPHLLYPLDIKVDGEHWRYATCYVTIGMTAEAVHIYDEPKIRQKLKTNFGRKITSYTALASWYFKHRHKKQFLPNFKLNNRPVHPKTSDYTAVNGRSMARLMKGRDDFLKPKIFRSETDRLTNFWRLIKLMTKSIFYRIPGSNTTKDTLEFTSPATIELQAEGEYGVFKDIKTIEIKKSARPLKVITKENR